MMLGGLLPLDDPTPAEVREKMREVFQRSEFRHDKSWLERVGDWIGRQLEKLFGGSAAGSGAGWGGSIGSVIVWVALFLVVVALVFLIVHVVRTRSPRAKKAKDAVADIEIDEARTASEWASEADQLEAAGAWKAAIRCRYRELVARLVEAGVAAPQAGRTTGELRTDVASAAPGVSNEFSDASVLFELPWFADAPTGPRENEQFKSLASKVLENVG